MSDKIEKEIEAIRTILTSLQSLDEETRKNVLEYVLKKINFDLSQLSPVQLIPQTPEIGSGTFQPNEKHEGGIIHIKQFKESKQPKSAIEMAAIVAYYLQYLAEEGKRKSSASISDMETWFRIADFPLPTEMRFVLTNAKNAGYLDSIGHGEYKLNAIGHNLVKHNLPRHESGSTPRKVKKPAPKKAQKRVSKKSSKK